MHWWLGGWGWLGWLTMSLVMVAFWALVIWLVASYIGCVRSIEL